MKQHTYQSAVRFFAVLLILLFIFSSYNITYAAPNIPQIVKVGLSYSSTANNNFVIKSDAGFIISIKNGTSYSELLRYPLTTGLKVRKDAFYNIVNGKESEITYVKTAQYTGELVGPYHIQIGDIYADQNSAKLVADSMAALSPTVFLAYENGWRVWAQLYLDEAECLAKIQSFQAAMPNYAYSVVAPAKGRVQMFDAATGKLLYIINANTDVKFEPIAAANTIPSISFNTLKYRGSLYIKRFDAGFINVYNELPFEQYLYGVVPAEMPSAWHMEALKAQAVSARNYGILSMGKHIADGFDLCNGTHCQAYRGFSHENPRTNQAVDETVGKLAIYNEKLITTYYHSSSGGRTENSENIWSAVVPYIRSVDDKYGLGSPYDNWVKQYSKNDIKTKLLANNIDVGEIIDIKPLEYSANGRVTLLEIKGTKTSTKLVKEKIRSIMGNTELRSIWYNLTTDADLFIKDSSDLKPRTERAGNLYVMSAAGAQKLSSTNNKIYVKNQTALSSMNLIPEYYVFTGKGNGHGLGMSQYGAKGMAEAGFNFIQILEYYYTGAKVQ